jgi:hypothetical protein
MSTASREATAPAATRPSPAIPATPAEPVALAVLPASKRRGCEHHSNDSEIPATPAAPAAPAAVPASKRLGCELAATIPVILRVVFNL